MTGGFEKYRETHNGITWKEYVDLRFLESERALELAERELNRRLEGMNELRSQLDRQSGTFPTKEQVETVISGVNSRIDALNKVALAAMAAGIVSLLAVIFTYLLGGK